jgi:ssDNA-binding replication factor A large subunit
MVETIDEMSIGLNFDRFECEVVISNKTNEYDRNGLKSRVQNLIVKDKKEKTVTLVLWNSQTDEFLPGDKILLKDGFCKEYDGNKQISTGKFGLITRVKCEEKKKKTKK